MFRKTALPELLSPAGSFDAVVAAVNAGADAVYFGGKQLNARAFAKNLDDREIARAILYCRLHGAKAYITLNTLLSERELEAAVRRAGELRELGADALIVADAGLISRLAEVYPDLPLHASTQASAHSTEGCDLLAKLGAKRVVLARELPYSEIVSVTENAVPETEIFLHGALCVCHSGQCLFSSLVGGRSGNRGACAQPCRLPYDGKERLSLRDLCLAPHIPELIASGVASLKIEGRMKSPGYVYGVTSVYRRLLDEKRAATPGEIAELERIFSRGGFTDGYFTGNLGRGMLGVRSASDKANSRKANDAGYAPIPVPVKLDCTVAPGVPSTLTLTAVGRSVTVAGETPQPAKSAPLETDALAARLTKLGGTFFTCDPIGVKIDLAPGLNLSPGAVNQLRRAAVSAWEAGERRAPLPYTERKTDRPFPQSPLLSVFCQTAKQLDAIASLLPAGSETFLPVWEEIGATTPSGVSFPAVIFDREREEVVRMAKAARARGIGLALVHNVGQIGLARSLGFTAIGSQRLNITNRESAAALFCAGLSDAVLSPELPLPAAAEVGGRILSYGYIPLMLTERCFIRENFGCEKCNKACFTDRFAFYFGLIREYPHRNQILNSVPTYLGDKRDELAAAGLRRLHLLFMPESPDLARSTLSDFLTGRALDGTVRRMPRTF
ncbi:MAG: U32 family peptidase [Clostridia bacterium]|nr:U32 family peptidase [Clostridia bacterium]